MRISNKLKASVALTSAAGLVMVSGCAANQPSGGSDAGINTLEVTSWWTSGSEAEALQVLIEGVEGEMPGLGVENAAVSGGGGANARQALAARLQAGSPPDTWQLHPAGQLKSYVDGGQVADLTQLWEENDWESKLPAELAEAQQVDGKYYTVPIAVGRGNVFWANPSVLEAAGANLDGVSDIDGMIEELQKVQEAGSTAVCLGDKDIFASSELLESLIMSRSGADNWNALFTNEYSFDSPEVRQGLEDYLTFLELANSDHSALTWDEAAKNLAAGECAVNLMGDWAYGELINAGFEYGTDFTAVQVPGEEDIFSYVGDGFSIPADNLPNPEAANAWLTTLMDPEVQLAFSVAKGSVPVRSDIDTSGLSEYQQSAAESLQNGRIVNSLAHSQASTAEIAQIYADAVTTLNGNGSIDAFIATMTQAQSAL